MSISINNHEDRLRNIANKISEFLRRIQELEAK